MWLCFKGISLFCRIRTYGYCFPGPQIPPDNVKSIALNNFQAGNSVRLLWYELLDMPSKARGTENRTGPTELITCLPSKYLDPKRQMQGMDLS